MCAYIYIYTKHISIHTDTHRDRLMPAHWKEPISNPCESPALVERDPAAAEPPALPLKEVVLCPALCGEWSQMITTVPCGPTAFDSHIRQQQQSSDRYILVPHPVPSHFLSPSIPSKVTCHQLIGPLCTSHSPQGHAQNRKWMKLVACRISGAILAWEQWLWLHILAPGTDCASGVSQFTTQESFLHHPAVPCTSPRLGTETLTPDTWGGWKWQSEPTRNGKVRKRRWVCNVVMGNEAEVPGPTPGPYKSVLPHKGHWQFPSAETTALVFISRPPEIHRHWFPIQLHHLNHIYWSLGVSIKSCSFAEFINQLTNPKFGMKSYGLELILLMKWFGDISKFFRMQSLGRNVIIAVSLCYHHLLTHYNLLTYIFFTIQDTSIFSVKQNCFFWRKKYFIVNLSTKTPGF